MAKEEGGSSKQCESKLEETEGTKRINLKPTIRVQNAVSRFTLEAADLSLCNVISYWESLDFDSKREFLRIRVDDFKNHFHTPDGDELLRYIDSLLSIVKDHASWKILYCACYTKDEMLLFEDSDHYRFHLTMAHGLSLLPYSNQVLPQKVGENWVEMIHHGSWQPLDSSGAAKMLENGAKLEDPWPASEDPGHHRTRFLQDIQGHLKILFENHFLAPIHLSHITKIAEPELLRVFAAVPNISNILQSPKCICILSLYQLEKVNEFLKRVIGAYRLISSPYLIKAYKSSKIIDSSFLVPEIKEQILLSEDASSVFLDQCLVPAPATTPESTTLADPFLAWIFSVSSLDQWLLWETTLHNSKQTSFQYVIHLHNTFQELNKQSIEKYRLMMQDKALEVVENLCKDNEKGSTKATLTKRRDKLKKKNNKKNERDVTEMKVIKYVLEKAQEIAENQSGKKKCSEIDKYIETVIERQKQSQYNKLVKIDGEIMRSVGWIDELKTELERISYIDCRLGFLPLVKTYLKARLVESAEKYAKENPEDALLAEIAEESEKATDVDEQHVLGTTPADYSSSAPDKKSPLEERIEEIEAQKRILEAKLKEIEAKKRSNAKKLEETEAKKKSFAEGKLLDRRVKMLEGVKTDFKEKVMITEEWIRECLEEKRCIADKEKEVEGEKRCIADKEKELEEEKWCIADNEKELEEEIGRIKIELEKVKCNS